MKTAEGHELLSIMGHIRDELKVAHRLAPKPKDEYIFQALLRMDEDASLVYELLATCH